MKIMREYITIVRGMEKLDALVKQTYTVITKNI